MDTQRPSIKSDYSRKFIFYIFTLLLTYAIISMYLESRWIPFQT